MNNPGQYLVHMTSRGPSVFNSQDGGAGLFKIVMKQPLKDINKFGLLHYSIPRRLDHLQTNNRSFKIVLGFANGTNVEIPVTLPMMNYYDCLISDFSDLSAGYAHLQDKNLRKNRVKDTSTAAFDEVLQTAINWSIMKHFTGLRGAASIPERMTARISCVCEFDRSTGCYKFTFGYRGYNAVNNDGTGRVVYQDGTLPNTGCPYATQAAGNAGIIQANTGTYTLLDLNGISHQLPAITQNHDQCQLVKVAFVDLPMRLQIMMGSLGSNIFSIVQKPPNHVVTRGRIRLVNYTGAQAIGSTGLVELALNIPPTLSPPSLLYLQLQVPGTKSKILGQDAERGGWAVPTPPNKFFSNYANFPNGQLFDKTTVRSTPGIQLADDPEAEYNTNFAMVKLNGANINGNGLCFDGIPFQNTTVIGQTNVKHADNFTAVKRQGIPGSRMIFFGCHSGKSPKDCITDPIAASKSMSTGKRFMPGTTGFSVGVTRQAEVFTASMITPNWIYTHTQDATIQTFDIQLIWGDTCDQVDSIVGNPVQFSMIAST